MISPFLYENYLRNVSRFLARGLCILELFSALENTIEKSISISPCLILFLQFFPEDRIKSTSSEDRRQPAFLTISPPQVKGTKTGLLWDPETESIGIW